MKKILEIKNGDWTSPWLHEYAIIPFNWMNKVLDFLEKTYETKHPVWNIYEMKSLK